MTRPMTRAGDFLLLSAQRAPDRACFVFDDGSRRTFAETNSRVNRLADSLAAAGVAKGARVAILATDSGEYVEVLIACMKLGAVYVPLNNRLTEPEVLTLLRRADPVAWFVGERYAGVARRLGPQLDGLRLTAALDGPGGDGLVGFADLVAAGTDREPDVPVSDDDVLGLAFTSGTTGLPKGVLQPQRMIKSLFTTMSIDYEIVPDEFRYTASPIFHIAGQGMILMHVMRTFPTLVLPQFAEEPVLRWMRSGELTGAFLVPTMISRLLEHPDVGEGSYEAVRSIIYGGAPITPPVLRRAMEVFGCDFINAFGAATEGGLQSVLSSAEHRRALAGHEHLLGSIGRPSYGVQMRLVGADGRDVPRGEVGEVVTRSDAVMSGYLEMPEETAQAIRGGWFHAGDLARMDEDGYLFLAGRSKDMIIRGGENVYPVEIETVLSRHPAVGQVAVIGRPDPHWGEVVVAYLVAAPGADPDPDELRAHCRAALAAYKVPAEFVVVAEMPLNASGKILKRELRVQDTSRSAVVA
jgi:acyl-CoA synthetase (AMP-forming)/AMP-acid ligase II